MESLNTKDLLIALTALLSDFHVCIQFDKNFLDSIAESNLGSILIDQNERECIIGIGQSHTFHFAGNEFRNKPNRFPIKGQLTYSDDKGGIYNDGRLS